MDKGRGVARSESFTSLMLRTLPACWRARGRGLADTDTAEEEEEEEDGGFREFRDSAAAACPRPRPGLARFASLPPLPAPAVTSVTSVTGLAPSRSLHRKVGGLHPLPRLRHNLGPGQVCLNNNNNNNVQQNNPHKLLRHSNSVQTFRKLETKLKA